MESQIVDFYNELPHGINVIDKMNEEFSQLQKENEIIKESASPEGGGIVFVVDDGFSNPVNENKFFKSHMKKLDFKVFQLTDCPSDDEMYENSCSSLLNDDFSKKLEETFTAMLEKQNTEVN